VATPLLIAEKITKSFDGVRALKGVSFELIAGEVHALVGENGAGKSTLIKIMTGAVELGTGTLVITGRSVRDNNPNVARSLGVVAIYQQPSLFPHLTLTENIALSLETGSPWRSIDWKARHERAQALLKRAGSSMDPDRLVRTLSMPEQQVVQIAKAIGADAKILIMDEPTSALTERETDSLFKVIAELKSHGVGIIYISHRLEEIFAIADRVTVLRDGEALGTWNANELDRGGLIHLMVGRPITAVYPKRQVKHGEIALEVRSLSNRASGVSSVSFAVRKGEILGVAGLVGSGRTQLAETLFGITPADSGEILVGTEQVRVATSADAIRSGIGYVPEDRRQHGVVLEMPITANTSLANLKAISHRGIVNRGAEGRLAQKYIAQLRIKAPSAHTIVGMLSGGNQQKVALSRWLAAEPKILILDEPTQGVDIGSKSEIHSLMVDLAEQGMAIIMISSELLEILGMSDRIIVMHGGSVSGILSREEATQKKILALSLGHAPAGDKV